jgi:hypothetical protein
MIRIPGFYTAVGGSPCVLRRCIAPLQTPSSRSAVQWCKRLEQRCCCTVVQTAASSHVPAFGSHHEAQCPMGHTMHLGVQPSHHATPHPKKQAKIYIVLCNCLKIHYRLSMYNHHDYTRNGTLKEPSEETQNQDPPTRPSRK